MVLSHISGAASFPDIFAPAEEPAAFRDLFNGKDLTGWVDVNTSKETWSVRDGLLVCTGHPIGVMRSAEQFENFILHNGCRSDVLAPYIGICLC